MKITSVRKAFYLPDELLGFILKRIESFPDATFSQNELTRVSKTSLENLKKQKLLQYVQYDPENEPHYSTVSGDSENESMVRRINGKLLAFPAEGKPLEVTDEDLKRWAFDINPLLEQIKSTNKLIKPPGPVSQRIHFIGEQEVSREKISVFLGLFGDDEQAQLELLSLRAKAGKFDQAIVLCPAYSIKSQDLLSRLTNQRITCVPFAEAFHSRAYEINFELVAKNQQGIDVTPKKTAAQIVDYSKHKYVCEDGLQIPGLRPKNRSNQVEINSASLKIGDSQLALLLQLVIAAKKNRKKGGWVVLSIEAGKYQPISNLRTAIQGSLFTKDGQKFIESDGSKQYRISTHPDFVTYDRAQLLRHPLSSIKALAKKLPK